MTAATGEEDRQDPLDRITAAARTLFAANGVAATRLEDVAQLVGISRQYLYRFVSGRDELIELVLVQRCREVGDILEERAQLTTDDVAGAIVDQIIAGISIGRDDPEFRYLAAALERTKLNMLLTSAKSPLLEINKRAFAPLLAAAIAADLLRSDVSVNAMVGWLQGVMTMLSGRDDLDESALRETVASFVLPSLFA